MAIQNLSGKLVFITGAASGIGHATSLAFAKAGARILAADLNQEALAELAREIKAAGGSCKSYRLDVVDASAFTSVAQEVIESEGAPDVLINNAGIGYMGSFLDTPPDRFKQVMDVNFYGVVNGCRAFLPEMIRSGGDKHLVNVASLASIAPVPNMSSYAASKYAVDGLTEVLAMELEGSSVDVTCVHPGIINTPIVSNDKAVAASVPSENLARLQRYYDEKGSSPDVVAQAIVRAVKEGRAHLFTGAKAPETAVLKRISPSLTRKLSVKSAKEVGYM